MAVSWTVKVKVRVDQVLEFERKVEADMQSEAESEAEDQISKQDIMNALEDSDGYDHASYESDAETDALTCDSCEEYSDDLEDGLCPDCRKYEDDDEEEESEVAE